MQQCMPVILVLTWLHGGRAGEWASILQTSQPGLQTAEAETSEVLSSQDKPP